MCRLKICSVVLLPALKPAWSSAMIVSACGFNLFSMIFSMALLGYTVQRTIFNCPMETSALYINHKNKSDKPSRYSVKHVVEPIYIPRALNTELDDDQGDLLYSAGPHRNLWWLFPRVRGFGRMFDNSFPARAFFFK